MTAPDAEYRCASEPWTGGSGMVCIASSGTKESRTVSGVPFGLGDHVDEDAVQRDRAAVVWPPRHVAGRAQRQGVDGGVRMSPRPALQPHDTG